MIIVGLTELHGIAREVMANPPEGVEYVEVHNTPSFTNYIFRSEAIGVLDYFEAAECDIIEAPLFPILTSKPWVYTPARFSGATSFTFFGIPIPRFIRVFFIKQRMLQANFIKLVFKSQAGLETLTSYAKINDPRILAKTEVAYPGMRSIPPELVRYNDDHVNFMCSGDFFLKGSANVVDAFERLLQEYSNISLRICASADLRMKDEKLRQEYIERIERNPQITFGRVDRNEMLKSVLPDTDVFVSPTYQEAFGFAILEASAYGIPVISTNHFAIPEIIEHGKSGFLIKTNQFDFIRKGNVTILKTIPKDFHKYMSDEVYRYMRKLLVNPELRKRMGQAGWQIASEKFSFAERNKKMKRIYVEGLSAIQGNTPC